MTSTTPHRWMLPARSIVMATMFLGAIVLAWAILPGDVERIAMLERDGKGRQVLAILERRFADGDRSQRTLYQLQQHYEHFGDLAKSRTMLETLAAQRPNDVQVQRRLALFYKQTQDAPAYVAALRRQLDLRYVEAACRELIGLLRQQGDFDLERNTIQDCRNRGYRRPDDLIRLATLLTEDGDIGSAIGLLRSADDLRRLKTQHERLRLFGNLVAIDQPREALRRAVRWLRGTRQEEFADLLIDQLVLANKHDIALDLVREVGLPGDAVSLSVGELMLMKDQDDAARAYLRGWLERARLTSPAMVSRFIRASLDASDPETAMKAAQRYGLQRVPQNDLERLSDMLAARNQMAEAEIVRSFVRADGQAARPIPRTVGRRSAATQPTTTEATRELEAWRLALWTQLMAPPEGSVASASDAAPIGSTRVGQTAKSRTAFRVLQFSKAKRTKPRPPAATAGATASAPQTSTFQPGSVFGSQ